MIKKTAWTRLSQRLENQEEFGPVKGNLPLVRIGLIWLAANLVVTTQLTGTLFVPGVSWPLALGLVVLGSMTGALVLILVGNIGTRTGLPTMFLSKGALGLRGSYAAVAANVIILMGWSWVQAMLAGITLDYVLAEATGFSNPVLLSALCQLLVVGLAIFGHAGIVKVEPFLAFIMLALMGYIFFIAFSTYPLTDYLGLGVAEDSRMPGILVFDIVVATAISWTVLSADFNRFALSQKAGMIGCGVGYVLSTSFAMCLGATAIAYILLKGQPIASFDPTVLVATFGVPLAIVIFLSVMATNTMVVYGMVTSIINMTPATKVGFLPTALIVGAISIVGATWLGLLDQFTAFLTLIGALFIPVFAIMIADYYIVQKCQYNRDLLLERGGRYWFSGGVNIPALLVWGVGFAASLFMTYFKPSPIGATIPTFFLSFALYSAWAIFTRKIVKGRPMSSHLGAKE